MSDDTPEVRIASGSPTASEDQAVRAAILKLWRDDQATAARDAAPDPWVLAARVEGARAGPGAVRAKGKASAWRLSGRVAAEPGSHISIGRGDAK
jgi:hypothetical protein